MGLAATEKGHMTDCEKVFILENWVFHDTRIDDLQYVFLREKKFTYFLNCRLYYVYVCEW